MSRRLPEPTSADLAAWRRLICEARRAAADPAALAGDLVKAERLAKRSIVLGELSRENPCIQLNRKAAQFIAETTRGRRELAPELARLADVVEALLPGARPLAPPTPAPAVDAAETRASRHRADIDGPRDN